MSAADGPVSRRRLRAGFGDCDPAGIVHYPTFFDWFDRATHELFAAAGVPMRTLAEGEGVMTPVVDVGCRFVRPVGWEDEVEIESRVVRWGVRSFTVAHRVLAIAGGACLAEGTEERVCVRRLADGAGISACEVPEAVRLAFGLAQEARPAG